MERYPIDPWSRLLGSGVPRSKAISVAGLRQGAALFLAAAPLLGLTACQPAQTPQKEMTRVVAETVIPEAYAPTTELTGTIAARIESDLSFRVGGQVAERHVDVGDHVKSRELLARIATDEPQATLDSTRAAALSAGATLKQAKANFNRQKTLLDGGYSTQSAFDSAEEAFRSAKNALDSARSDVATAEEQLTYTDLRAPAAGIVTARNVEQGQVVTAAQTVFTLALDGPRDAIFDIYESAMTEEPVGGKVQVQLVSDPSVRATALVREISPAFDTATGTLRIKLGLVDAPPQMTLGAAIAGTATFSPLERIRLPWTALYSTKGEPSVWVVDPQTQIVSQRRISIDRYVTGAILADGGLEAGETVVTNGAQLLRPGETVSIVRARTPASGTDQTRISDRDDARAHAKVDGVAK